MLFVGRAVCGGAAQIRLKNNFFCTIVFIVGARARQRDECFGCEHRRARRSSDRFRGKPYPLLQPCASRTCTYTHVVLSGSVLMETATSRRVLCLWSARTGASGVERWGRFSCGHRHFGTDSYMIIYVRHPTLSARSGWLS